MTGEELLKKLQKIQKLPCETQTLELKAAEKGCPQRLYDTLSAFSNQDAGGIMLFGVDEQQGYAECGVYDPQDLQKKINEQCLQMEPVVRPLLTVVEKDGKAFVSAEIPGLELSERPCYYRGRGRLKGSYLRVGDSDEPMTEYEVYRYEAYRKRIQEDIRILPGADLSSLDPDRLADYLRRVRQEKPHCRALEDDTLCTLLNLVRDRKPTLTALLLFCPYPQTFFPQLCLTAVAIPGTEMGETGEQGERFLDNDRIEGTLPEILEEAAAFVRRNMRTMTIINPETGRREDRTEYPMTAVREALINALVHRDYSRYTEGMPVQLRMYQDRLEISNPGGLYGRLPLSQLGRQQPDTRNPVLVGAMEVIGLTENRYSGIPTMRRVMTEYGLRPPVFEDRRGTFVTTLYKEGTGEPKAPEMVEKEERLKAFLNQPRSRKEIMEFLGLTSPTYAIHTYITPLVKEGSVALTLPDKPGSSKQKFYRTEKK